MESTWITENRGTEKPIGQLGKTDIFFYKHCILLQGLDMLGLEVHGQKIQTPAKKTQQSSNWVPMTVKGIQNEWTIVATKA